MGVDFTTIYPSDGGEPWEASCDYCGLEMDLDHHGDMMVHTAEHRAFTDERASKIEVPSVPLMMGDKIIGHIAFSLKDGLSGEIQQEAINILRKGIDGSVSLASISEMAAKKNMSVQEKRPNKEVVERSIYRNVVGEVERTRWSDNTITHRHRERMWDGTGGLIYSVE